MSYHVNFSSANFYPVFLEFCCKSNSWIYMSPVILFADSDGKTVSVWWMEGRMRSSGNTGCDCFITRSGAIMATKFGKPSYSCTLHVSLLVFYEKKINL